MNFNGIRVFGIVLVAFACLSQGAWARDAKSQHMGKDIFKEINLTGEQKGKLQALRNADKEQILSLRKQKRELKQKLDTAMASTASKVDLRKIHDEIKATEAKIDQLRFEQILSIRELLSQEQRVKFKELKEARRAKHKEPNYDEGE